MRGVRSGWRASGVKSGERCNLRRSLRSLPSKGRPCRRGRRHGLVRRCTEDRQQSIRLASRPSRTSSGVFSFHGVSARTTSWLFSLLLRAMIHDGGSCATARMPLMPLDLGPGVPPRLRCLLQGARGLRGARRLWLGLGQRTGSGWAAPVPTRGFLDTRGRRGVVGRRRWREGRAVLLWVGRRGKSGVCGGVDRRRRCRCRCRCRRVIRNTGLGLLPCP